MKVNVERNVLDGFFPALGIPTVLGIHTCTATRDLPTSDQLVSYSPEAHYHIGQLYILPLQLETKVLKTSNGDFMLSGFFVTCIEKASMETGVARKHSVDFGKTLVSHGKKQSKLLEKFDNIRTG